MKKEFRNLPSVDKILTDESIKRLLTEYSHGLITEVAREQLDTEREAIGAGNKSLPYEDIISAVIASVYKVGRPSLVPVINASGVILHTNLGRSPLSKETIAAMERISGGFCNLEFDLESGNRGKRQVHIENLLCRLTGAEAALVVNNNASAVMLGLSALAKRKEIIVSRGQAVEIGGGFRVPDVMRQSGAKLVEVGTTNCTYARDYEQAVTERTVGLMRVHSSNFRLVGFTNEITLAEMVKVARRCGLFVLDDVGSGCLLDTAKYGLIPEPNVIDSIAEGADAVFFSGDKLLGGPQAGIIVGKKQYLDKLKKHSMARAARIDKIRLAGISATLRHYLKGEAEEKIPIWRMIAAPLLEIEKRAYSWAETLGGGVKVIDSESMVGGGSLPGGTLPTKVVAIGGGRGGKNLVQRLSRELRQGEVVVVGRISEDSLLLDPRSVLPEEDGLIISRLKKLKI